MRSFCAAAAVAAIAAAPALAPAESAAPAPSVQDKPQRIMSVNLCTDLLLAQMAPKERIASISFIAAPRFDEILPGLDDGIPVNRAEAEDIVIHRPDLILAGDYASPRARDYARRIGARIVEIPAAQTFDEIRANIRTMGEVIGEPARAEAMIAEMDAKLARLSATSPEPRPRVLAWSGGVFAPGADSLANTIIEAAGARNVAAEPGVHEAGFDIESLLAARPDVLLQTGYDLAAPSLRRDQALHRVIRKVWEGRRLPHAEAPYVCGLPQTADAAVRLQEQLRGLGYGAEQ